MVGDCRPELLINKVWQIHELHQKLQAQSVANPRIADLNFSLTFELHLDSFQLPYPISVKLGGIRATLGNFIVWMDG